MSKKAGRYNQLQTRLEITTQIHARLDMTTQFQAKLDITTRLPVCECRHNDRVSLTFSTRIFHELSSHVWDS